MGAAGQQSCMPGTANIFHRRSASAARSILGEAGSIVRAWWGGVLGFDESEEGRPSTLSGRTALFHPSGIPDEDDLFMAFTDAAFILDRLADWAKRHTIKWRLRMHDEDWGAVDPGGLTQPLYGRMEKWARRVRVLASGRDAWFIPMDRRAEVLARHAGRKEV